MTRVVTLVLIALLFGTRPAPASLGDCGQPISNGASPTATDALAALKAAVGLIVCELCVCDADDSGILAATDALIILAVAVGQPLPLGCPSCGDEGAFPDPGTGVAVETIVMTPEAGGMVELGGGRLEIAPSVLSEAAEIGLLHVRIGSGFDDDAGALGGQLLLSHDAFVIVSNRDVDLSGPVSLTLPIDPALVPDGATAGDINMSITSGGYTISQGPPDFVDLDAGLIRVDINVPRLLMSFESMTALGRPRAAGWSFGGMMRGMWDGFLSNFTGLASWVDWVVPNAAVATIDDILTAASVYAQEASDHFRVRFRGSQMDFADAREMTAALESAHDLLVDGLGFSRRTLNLPGDRYVVYFDDFANHRWLPDDADGFTLPDSRIFDGASYVNTRQARTQWAATAVHEYFHTLQAGSFSKGIFALNAVARFERMIEAQSDWLYEGSATALGARIVLGGGTAPTRDPRYANSISPGYSVYDPDGQPIADAAQDFFVFLESYAGNDVSLYKTIYDSLGGLPFSLPDAPGSVEAVDQALGAVQGVSIAWLDFVRELTTNEPSSYGAIPNVQVETFEIDPASPSEEPSIDRTIMLPPMSYHVLEVIIPPVDSGVSAFEQARDLVLTVSVSQAPAFELLDVHAYNLRTPGDPPVSTAVSELGDAILTIPEARQSLGDTRVRLVFANGYFESGDTVEMDVTAGLRIGSVDLSRIGGVLVDLDILGSLRFRNPDGTFETGPLMRFERRVILPGSVVDGEINMSCIEASENDLSASVMVGEMNETNTAIDAMGVERTVDIEVLVEGEPQVVRIENYILEAQNLPIIFPLPSRIPYRVKGFDVCSRIGLLTWNNPFIETSLVDYACNEQSELVVNLLFDDQSSVCND